MPRERGEHGAGVEAGGMAVKLDHKAILRRMVEIDYKYKHRHLPSNLTALPIILSIFEDFDEKQDVFILSKGHSCAALYAVLEALGKHPDCSLVHPERDVANGVTITAGSLGHGLPIAVGMAYARRLLGKPGLVHILIGDGESQEGTTYEALNLAERLLVHDNLRVHLDWNGFQGSERCSVKTYAKLVSIFPIHEHAVDERIQISMIEADLSKRVLTLTDEDYRKIMEEIG